MDLKHFMHLPKNPEPVKKGSSVQYDLYAPHELALVGFKNDSLICPVIVVGLLRHVNNTHLLVYDHKLSSSGMVIGPDYTRIADIRVYRSVPYEFKA